MSTIFRLVEWIYPIQDLAIGVIKSEKMWNVDFEHLLNLKDIPT